MIEWALAATLVVGAPGAKEKGVDPPPGEWEAVLFVQNGRTIIKDPKPEEVVRMRFTRTAMTSVVPAARWERTEDVAFSKAGGVLQIDIRPWLREKVELGIWKVDGDTLTICAGLPGKPRPTDFTCPEDSDRILWVLKRVKKD